MSIEYKYYEINLSALDPIDEIYDTIGSIIIKSTQNISSNQLCEVENFLKETYNTNGPYCDCYNDEISVDSIKKISKKDLLGSYISDESELENLPEFD